MIGTDFNTANAPNLRPIAKGRGARLVDSDLQDSDRGHCDDPPGQTKASGEKAKGGGTGG